MNKTLATMANMPAMVVVRPPSIDLVAALFPPELDALV